MVGLKLDLKNAGITENSILKYSKKVERNSYRITREKR